MTTIRETQVANSECAPHSTEKTSSIEEPTARNDKNGSSFLSKPESELNHLSNRIRAEDLEGQIFHGFDMDNDLQTLDQDELRGLALVLEEVEGKNSNETALLSAISFFRFMETKSSADLDKSIIWAEKSFLMNVSDPAPCMVNYGRMLAARYTFTGKVEDLEAAISLVEEAVDTTAETDSCYSAYLRFLTALLTRLYQLTSSPNDFERAAEAARKTVIATPMHSPNRGAPLVSLATAISGGFHILHQLPQGIQLAKEAAEATLPEYQHEIDKIDDIIDFLTTMKAHDVSKSRQEKYEDDGNTIQGDRARSLDNKPASLLDRPGQDEGAAVSTLATRPQSSNADNTENLVLAKSLSLQASTLFFQYQEEKHGGNLDIPITHAQLAVDLTPPDHPNLANRLASLGTMLFTRFTTQEAVEDLHAAITCLQKAVELTPSNHRTVHTRVGLLITMLLERFQEVKGKPDLDAMFKYSQRALDVTDPNQKSSLARELNNTGIKLVNLFEELRTVDILDTAVSMSQIAVDITAPGDPSLPNKLNSLAKALGERCKETKSTDGLETAICTAQRSVEITHPDDPDLVIPLTSLASLLGLRYDSLGEEEDLDNAIIHIGNALDISTDLPETVIVLSGLADELETRYNRTKERKDLDAAVIYAQRALDITPPDHSKLVDRMISVHNKLTYRYMATDKQEDLNAILIHARRAISIQTSDHAELVRYLHALSRALEQYHRTTHSIEILDTAVTLGQRALDIAPLDDSKISNLLTDLGAMLHRQNLLVGNIKKLDQWITHARRAVALSYSNEEDLIRPLASLGVFLERRYFMTLRSEDLHEAIEHSRRAAEIKTSDPEVAAAALSTLSNRLVTRHKLTGNTKDLEDGIAYGREALGIMMPTGNKNISVMLHDLAVAMVDLYDTNEDVNDLNSAIEYCRSALEKTPVEEPLYLALFLYTSGSLLVRRYCEEGRIEDLDAAIADAQRSVDLSDENDSALSERLFNLGAMLIHRDGYGDAALACFTKARNCRTASAMSQVQAGRRAIDILIRQGNLSEASSQANGLISLLPIICNRSLNRTDQQHAVSLTTGLAAAACSLSLMTENNPEKALEYLENGRGLIIGYMIDGRGEFSELRKEFPAKARVFDALRIKASRKIDAEEQSDREQLLLERDEAARALEDCVNEIRRLPGYKRFLRLPSSDVLRSYAEEGPIAVVNSSEAGSHAILILKTGTKVVQLPDLKDLARNDSVQRRLVRCATTRHVKVLTRQVEHEYQDFLLRLWSDCVRLVLDAIGPSENPVTLPLRRIWWMGTGFAGMLPFHAAGDHSLGSVDNTFSRIISSYIPSIKALRYARERANLGLERHSILLVTMPETPGSTPLPGVEDEADIIYEMVKSSVSYRQRLRQPSAAEVLDILKRFSIAHFACHGSSDLQDPSSSYLALQGPSAAIPDRLTVQKVSDIKLTAGWLAYLSACSTAENNVSSLADEALHLASSFQVAGFGHVVASMWPSNDKICVEVATIFYQELFHKGGLKMGNMGVAQALHTAVMAIRQKNMQRPDLWAQYIHSGA